MKNTNRTVIAYETKGGATEESAQKIAQVLRSRFHLEVDLVDLKKQKNPNLAAYSSIVLGSGIRGGKMYDKMLKLLENDFCGRKVAFFVCSGDAGTPEKYQDTKAKFLESTLSHYPKIAPVEMEAFGGRMKMLGRMVLDNLDLGMVEAWATKVGEKFTQ
jgi:menaquinone-dependent protoporphyrinogen IX oxidase